MSEEGNRKMPAETDLIQTNGELNEEQKQCMRTAFTPAFSHNDRVCVSATCIDLSAQSFLVVERTISGRDESVYRHNSRVWEHIPRGQVCVFAADPLHTDGTVQYKPVGWLQGLRKFGFFDKPYGPQPQTQQPQQPQQPNDDNDDSSAVVDTIAMEMLDGECGHLSAVAVPGGGRYWLIGSREAHLLVRFDVPEEDIAANRGAYTRGKGAAAKRKEKNETSKQNEENKKKTEGGGGGGGEEKEEEEEESAIPVRIARLWRTVLLSLSPDHAAALHTYLSAAHRTACFDAILSGTGRLVDYNYNNDYSVASGHTAAALRFYAVTARNGSGLCLAPDDGDGNDRLAGFGLHVVQRSERVALHTPQYAAQCSAVARRLNSKGAVVYGLNRKGVVVRMWRLPAYVHALERAAQEAIATHSLCGPELRAQLQRKLSGMPQDVRACLVEWESQRLPQLVELAAWLRLTGRIAPLKDLAALRSIRMHWVTLQRKCAAITDEAERARLRNYIMPTCDVDAVSPDVIICMGPQGCGKSTFARTLCALLLSAGHTPCWINQDEHGGSRGPFLAALRSALANKRYSHIVVDKINLDGESRADYTALNICGISVAWIHPNGAKALGDICVERVCGRGAAHRRFTPKALAVRKAHSPNHSRSYKGRGGRGRGRGRGRAGARAGENKDNDVKDEEEGLARMRGIVRSSARRYRVHSDGPLVEVDVRDPRESAIESVWAALRLYSKADLPPLDTLDVPAAMDMAQKYEEMLRAGPRRVQYAAIQIEKPEEIKALVPPALVEGKCVQEAFHITTKYFGGEVDSVMLMRLNALLGKPIEVTLTRVVSDNKGTAIAVRNENEFPCANAHPHITIANLAGVSPKYSNELLAQSSDKNPDLIVVDLPDGTTARGTFVFIYK